MKIENKFFKFYCDFEGKMLSEESLTQKRMQTIKMAIHANMFFEVEMFQIIKSHVLEEMVIKCDPQSLVNKRYESFYQ